MVFTIDRAWMQTESPTPTQEPLTFDQAVGTLPVVDDARWSANLTDSSLPAMLVWIVMLLVLQVVGLPIARRLFSRFPDAGWGFSRVLALSLGAFAVWFPSAMHWTTFTASFSILAVAAIGGSAWFALFRRSAGWPRLTWSMGAAEILFWIVFSGFLVLRMMNPDSYEPVWGGEKPMEFAHLNAVLRSAQFPPVDPWYAGGYLNYYYYGTYLIAFMVKLTGIPAEIAFNLGLPAILAMLATGMFSLCVAIGRSILRRRYVPVIVGVAGAVFSVGIGNLVAATRVYESITSETPVDLWSTWVWGPTRIFPNFVITEFPFFAGLYGDLHAHTIALPLTVMIVGIGFNLVLSREDFEKVPAKSAMLAFLPALSVLGVLLGTLFMTNAWDAPAYAVMTVLAIIAATTAIAGNGSRVALIVGSVAFIGVVAAIVLYPFNKYYVALFSDVETVPDKTPLLPVEAHWGGFLLILTAGFVTMAYRSARRPPAYLDPVIVLPALCVLLIARWYAIGRSESLMTGADYATVIVVVAVWLAVAWWRSGEPGDFSLAPAVMRILIAAGSVVAFWGIATERPVFALFAGVGSAAGVAWLAHPTGPERVIWAAVAVGMLLGAALEIVFLVDDLVTTDAYRMNTVFKFYNQLWTLFAVASSGCVAIMLRDSGIPERDRDDGAEARDPGRSSGVVWSRAGLAIAALVIVLGFAYPAQATGVRLDTRFPHPNRNWTLDAYAWMEYGTITFTDGTTVGYADDLAAIDWFNAEVAGTPVIAEASVHDAYRCNGSRFSIATGLPAVIGWQRHESQQRYTDHLLQRERDLFEIYVSTDPGEKLQLLDAYHVEYLVVGQTERLYPDFERGCQPQDVAAGIAAIESMVGTSLEVAFQHGSTTVYRVVR
jgi:YYY domain-containing protein